MNLFFGLLTALAVAAWGVYWYAAQPRNRLRERLRAMPRVARPRPAEPAPLVPPEAAAQLLQSEPEPSPAPASQVLERVDEPAEGDAVEATSDPLPEPVIATSASTDTLSEPAPPMIELESSEENKPPALTPEASRSEPLDDQPAPESQRDDSRENSDEAPLQAEPQTSAEPPEPSVEARTEEIMGHCSRCRARRVLLDPTPATTKRGKPGVRGQCPVCGAGIFVLVSEKR